MAKKKVVTSKRNRESEKTEAQERTERAHSHMLKKQTKPHIKKMKEMLIEIMDCGFTADEVIDLGDYLLENMSMEELTGAKNETDNVKGTPSKAKKPSETKDTGTKQAKKGSKVKAKGDKGKKGKGKKGKSK